LARTFIAAALAAQVVALLTMAWLVSAGRPGTAGIIIPNDALATAEAIAFQPYTNSGFTAGATTEVGETTAFNACQGDFAGAFTAGSTVWYKYTHTGSPVTLQLDTIASTFDTTLAIYSGPASSPTFGGLTQVACGHNEFGANVSALTFAAATNQTYYIQAGGLSGASGFLILNLSHVVSNAGLRFTVNSTADTGDPSADGVCDSGGGVCTLREAIQEANAAFGTDNIWFSIGSGVVTIAPGSDYPFIDGVVIDARTQPGFTSAPIVVLDGVSVPGYGLQTLASPVSIRVFVMHRYAQAAMLLNGNGKVVQGNYVGISSNGLSALGGGFGVYIAGDNNVIGGTTSFARNVISGTQTGVFLDGGGGTVDNNVVYGNYIGVNAAGSGDLGNVSGVFINGNIGATGNLIGGSIPGARNVISGNDENGVSIVSAGATGNTVAGNFIGTNAGGSGAIPNSQRGVRVAGGANNNIIGGTVAAARNVISGNTLDGVIITGATTTPNKVQGNIIGLNHLGLAKIPNGGAGVYIENSPSNLIGGPSCCVPPGPAGNTISGNVHGIVILGDSADTNSVEGNIVGLDLTGQLALGNTDVGIWVLGGADFNEIGAQQSQRRNVVSGNGRGVAIFDSGTVGNVIVGNYVGTDYTGYNAIPNSEGIGIGYGSSGTTVGGGTVGEGNVISGNGHGIRIGEGSPSTLNTVRGNYIGTNADGTGPVPNTTFGVGVISGSDTNTIGPGNVISGNTGNGVEITNAYVNTVKGNFIGTNSAGTGAVANGANGLVISGGESNVIGGSAAEDRNIISGNADDGIRLDNTGVNTIKGNRIGTNAAGTAAVPNSDSGIQVVSSGGSAIGGSTGTTPGGACTGDCNLISGNTSRGFTTSGEPSGNIVLKGNFVGTNAAGTASIANGFEGIMLQDGDGNSVGGTTPAERNVISGNGTDGVRISGSDGNTVRGNYIGTNSAGTADLGNGEDGVDIVGTNQAPNVIGGTTSTTPGGACTGACNVISGNNSRGINIRLWGHSVKGNVIGTNAAGNAAIGNSAHGIWIQSLDSVIGGATPAERNVISGNGINGVLVAWHNNTVKGNYIGATSDGLSPLGNGSNGVLVAGGITGNVIGGTAAGEGNTIAYNSGAGVGLANSLGSDPTNTRIQRNSTYSNGGLGIDLNVDGITANDAGDADTGPNNRQNFPVLTVASFGSGLTTIDGSLNSTANTQFTIEFFHGDSCDPSGNGEGHTFLGQTVVTTDGAGNVNFGPSFATGTPLNGRQLTATATNPTGNTSELSTCIPAVNDADDDDDGYTDIAEAGTPLCGNALDDDSDGTTDDGCPAGPAQLGPFSEAQFKIGTGPMDPCGLTGWPSDLVSGSIPNSTNALTIADITGFLGPVRRLDKNPGQTGFDSRWDVAPGRSGIGAFLNIVDITTLLGGTTGNPPMFGNTRAFGKTCPYPP
jgi:CSLREA domain-containing protein